MKTSTKIIAATATLAALALAGAAFGHPGAGMGPGFGMGPGYGMGPGVGPAFGMGPGWGRMGGGPAMMGAGGFDMNAAAAGRLAALKTQLKITPAQEPAWKAYETAVTQQAGAMQKLRDQFHAQWDARKPGEAAPDFAAQRQAMFAQREAGWQAQDKARKELLAVLTPEQQAFVNGSWHGPWGGGPRQR